MVRAVSLLGVARRLYSSAAGNMVRARKYMLVKHFKGEPKESDFQLIDEELPPLKDGEFLAQAEFLSVDPYMRAYMINYQLPTLMIGGQVAKVTESKNDKFPVGARVTGSLGWRSHTVIDPTTYGEAGLLPLTVLPDLGEYSPSLALGVLGMPGNTAYFGLKELCTPKPGETLVVTGAAGAVGTHVGQIGKIMGLRVIGFAGSDLKCQYLEKELGFDRAYNYKKVNVREALKEGAPNGVDCYFDNVGGEISSIIMNKMNRFGRVAVCGSISSYNDDVSQLPTGRAKHLVSSGAAAIASQYPKTVPIPQPTIVFKELRIEGFIVRRWAAAGRWDEGIEANLAWLREGKLKYREHVWEGFGSMVEALVGMLRGENTGKAIVKV